MTKTTFERIQALEYYKFGSTAEAVAYLVLLRKQKRDKKRNTRRES